MNLIVLLTRLPLELFGVIFSFLPKPSYLLFSPDRIASSVSMEQLKAKQKLKPERSRIYTEWTLQEILLKAECNLYPQWRFTRDKQLGWGGIQSANCMTKKGIVAWEIIIKNTNVHTYMIFGVATLTQILELPYLDYGTYYAEDRILGVYCETGKVHILKPTSDYSSQELKMVNQLGGIAPIYEQGKQIRIKMYYDMREKQLKCQKDDGQIYNICTIPEDRDFYVVVKFGCRATLTIRQFDPK